MTMTINRVVVAKTKRQKKKMCTHLATNTSYTNDKMDHFASYYSKEQKKFLAFRRFNDDDDAI